MTNDLLKFCFVGNTKRDVELVVEFLRASTVEVLSDLQVSYREQAPFTIAETPPTLAHPVAAAKALEYVASTQASFPTVLCVAYTADPDAGLGHLTGVAHWELPRYNEDVLEGLLTGSVEG